MTGEVRSATFRWPTTRRPSQNGWILDPAAKCVYRSGVTGFDLQKEAHGAGRRLRRRRGLEDVEAIGRKKNDRNDAGSQARMLSVGNVIGGVGARRRVRAARDLVRALD